MKNRILLKWLCLTLFVFGSTLARSQNTISGKVTDENGELLPGVNILVKNSTSGTTTDANGSYSLSLNEELNNPTLVFSFIGYVTEEVELGGRSVVNVSLLPNIETLAEIVVVGYGVQKRRDITGAITQVKSETLQEVASPNVFNQLKGRAAGVSIVSTGSTPGSSAQIRIRGNRSLVAPVMSNQGSNAMSANATATAARQDELDAPLLVVDGIPYGGNINDISPDDIASMEILKDASATAIYGSRGAGGVILISTKRGVSGKTSFTYDGYYGASKIMDKLRVFNGQELAEFKSVSGYGLATGEQEALDEGVDTDWQDLIYQTGFVSSHTIGARGGTDAAQFSMGVSYFKESGIIPNQDFERFSIRGTIDNKVSDKIKIGMNTINTLSYQNTPGGSGVPVGLMRISPLAKPYNDDGSVNLLPLTGHIDESTTVNPLTLITRGEDIKARTRRLRTFNSLYGEIEIVEGLKYRLNVGLDYTQTQADNFSPANTYVNNASSNSQARSNTSNNEFFRYTIENLLMYNKTFNEKHNLGLTAMFSAQKDHSQGSGIYGVGIPADYVQQYNMALVDNVYAVDPLNSGNSPFNFSERGLLSYMGRATYAYDGRYSITATVRADGSSILAEGNQWYTYPAFAAAWNISNESFMSDATFISNLKLRAGWGITSNQSFPPYQTLGLLSASTYNFGKTTSGNQLGYLVTNLPNENLSWQSTSQFNFGLDFGLFGNRITGALEVYSMQTKDILLTVQLPDSNGASATSSNLGKTKSHGLELTIGADIIKNPDGFNWNADVNYFFNREEIVSLTTPDEKENIGNGWFVGQPFSVIYDVEKIGIWQTEDNLAVQKTPIQQPGQIRVLDVNGDSTINASDRKILGNFQPKFEAGFTNRFTFKNFDLTIVTYARMGMKVVVPYVTSDGGFSGYFAFMQGRSNQLKVDYWTPDNPTNAFPAPDQNTDRPLWSSTLGYMDGSFVKVRSINLGYKFSPGLLSKIGLTSARVYFSAVNPFILYSPIVRDGFAPDPEGNGYGGAISSPDAGADNGTPLRQITVNANNPSTRQFIVGLNIGF